MTLLHAIIHGAIQGFTEFVPVSSSGHLLLLPWFFGWGQDSLTFDVALHLGTALALVAYFGRDWWQMIISFLVGCRRKGDVICEATSQPAANGYMVVPVLLACIPAGILGILFENVLENSVRESRYMPLIIALTLAVMGSALYLADKLGKKKRNMEEMNGWDWVTIGLAQALALVPGVSRSGSTISMGLFRDLKREAAAYFSFLLSAPVIFGAAGLKLVKVAKHGLPHGEAVPFVAGIVTATVVGYLCIAFLMNYLRKHSVGLFVWYRYALAGIVLLTWFFGKR